MARQEKRLSIFKLSAITFYTISQEFLLFILTILIKSSYRNIWRISSNRQNTNIFARMNNIFSREHFNKLLQFMLMCFSVTSELICMLRVQEMMVSGVSSAGLVSNILLDLQVQ